MQVSFDRLEDIVRPLPVAPARRRGGARTAPVRPSASPGGRRGMVLRDRPRRLDAPLSIASYGSWVPVLRRLCVRLARMPRARSAQTARRPPSRRVLLAVAAVTATMSGTSIARPAPSPESAQLVALAAPGVHDGARPSGAQALRPPGDRSAAATVVAAQSATVASAVPPPARPTSISTARIVTTLAMGGIPEVALYAYVRAEQTVAVADPSCGLTWSLLAAIGRVESDHGRFGGARLREDGDGTTPIRGIPLDGRPGVALIHDTDDGALDGDRVYDRGVGPMQFIPSTWRRVAADGNGDGRHDPDNIFDAALGAGTYLCSGQADLRNPADRAAAVMRYNRSSDYVAAVLRAGGRVRLEPSDVIGCAGTGADATTPAGHGAPRARQRGLVSGDDRSAVARRACGPRAVTARTPDDEPVGPERAVDDAHGDRAGEHHAHRLGHDDLDHGHLDHDRSADRSDLPAGPDGDHHDHDRDAHHVDDRSPTASVVPDHPDDDHARDRPHDTAVDEHVRVRRRPLHRPDSRPQWRSSAARALVSNSSRVNGLARMSALPSSIQGRRHALLRVARHEQHAGAPPRRAESASDAQPVESRHHDVRHEQVDRFDAARRDLEARVRRRLPRGPCTRSARAACGCASGPPRRPRSAGPSRCRPPPSPRAAPSSGATSPAGTGRYTVKRVPRPGTLSTVTVPPVSETMSRTVDRPRPAPWPSSLVV